jgi:hypothetical protein
MSSVLLGGGGVHGLGFGFSLNCVGEVQQGAQETNARMQNSSDTKQPQWGGGEVAWGLSVCMHSSRHVSLRESGGGVIMMGAYAQSSSYISRGWRLCVEQQQQQALDGTGVGELGGMGHVWFKVSTSFKASEHVQRCSLIPPLPQTMCRGPHVSLVM